MQLERQEHSEKNPWWGEHVHRYHVALNYVNDNDTVLDIASGNGFGSVLVSERTKNMVIGGDISEEAIRFCKTRFSNYPNLRFEQMDGTKLSFPDCMFNKVISFETIEHTTEFHSMLSEFKRVLTSDGTLILSTPNFKINSPKGILVNPFHTQEFELDELKDILQSYFGNVSVYGQKYSRYKNKTFRNGIAKSVENLLYLRGVRKLPMRIQDGIMRMVAGKDLYPTPDDYEMIKDPNNILKCKTFFAICKKA